MKSPAIVEKYKQGPVGMMSVFPSGPPVMATFLGPWFVYCLIIGFFVAYLTAHTVAPRAYALLTAGTSVGCGHAEQGIVADSPSAHSTRDIGSGTIVQRFVENSKSEAKRKPDFGHDRYFQLEASSGGREIMGTSRGKRIPKIDDDSKH